MDTGEGALIAGAAIWDNLRARTATYAPSSDALQGATNTSPHVNAMNNYNIGVQRANWPLSHAEHPGLLNPGPRFIRYITLMRIYFFLFTFLLVLNNTLDFLASMAIWSSWPFAAKTPVAQNLLMVRASFSLILSLYCCFLVLYRMSGGGRGERWETWERRTRLNIGYARVVAATRSGPLAAYPTTANPASGLGGAEADLESGPASGNPNDAIAIAAAAAAAPATTHASNTGTPATVHNSSRPEDTERSDAALIARPQDLDHMSFDELLRLRREVRWFMREKAIRAMMEWSGVYLSVGEMKWCSVVIGVTVLFFWGGLGAAFGRA